MLLHCKKYLDDILYSIENIEEFLDGINSFSDYSSDNKTKSAIERQLGIIGEAANKYEKAKPKVSLENISQITGLRNRIIHAYDNIDDAIIWAIIQNHLPKLKREVKQKLR